MKYTLPVPLYTTGRGRADRQRGRQAERQTKQRGRPGGEADRQRGRQAERQRDREAERQRGRPGREADRHK
jgi:hypothetical protein